ncbi:MAG: hypothetical protein WC980_08890 [Candidatus Brocadiia bacterium]
MAFNKKFELTLRVPENWEVAGHMADNWEKHMMDAAELMKGKLDEKFPDDGTFINTMVNPSSNAFGPFVNPAFMSKSERTLDNIRRTRQSNLSGAFLKWKENLAKAFATVDGVIAKLFKDKVQAAKDRWALKMGKGALRFTGDKARGLGVAPFATYYLVGDERAEIWPAPGTADGKPYNIAKIGQRNAVKAAILQRFIQGGIMIANSGNDAADEILRQNGINAELLTSLRDPAKSDAFVDTPAIDKCYCSWEVDAEGRLVLRVQVGLTV